MPVVVQVLVFGAKMGVSCSFGVLFLFLTELIPTVVRNMGIGTIATVSHTGTVICPYILYLGKCFLVSFIYVGYLKSKNLLHML